MMIPFFKTKICINNEFFTILSFRSLTLNDILSFFCYEKKLILVEYNNKICNTNQGYNLIIKNMDKIEVITIVGGG